MALVDGVAPSGKDWGEEACMEKQNAFSDAWVVEDGIGGVARSVGGDAG
jgi:hypothetical protein